MDGNAKIGLLGEAIPRNRRLMNEMIEECELVVMNDEAICEGKITRQNRKNEDEKSAIDLIIATYEASQWFRRMIIDELGEHRMRNKNDSDHNTITACIDIISGTKKKGAIKTDWNLKAPEEKWEQFRKELRNSVEKAKEIMKNKEVEMSERYTKWEGLIYKAAIKTIGRTTFKKNGNKKPSKEIQKLRKEKTVCRTDFEKEENHQQKGDKLRKYIQ